jgi:hypothetical protein
LGFLPGYSWEHNPGADAAQGYLGDAMGQIQGMKTGSPWLRAMRKGNYDTTVGNPFLAQLGAQNRLVDSNIDPFLPPEIAEARAGLQKNRNQEQAGMNYQNYISQALQTAMSEKGANKRFKYGTIADLARSQADTSLGSYQGHQTSGWGMPLLQAGLGAAQAASGLGFKPFG